MHSTSSSPSDVPRRSDTAGAAMRADALHCRHCDAVLAGRYCHACGEDSMPPETSWHGVQSQLLRLVRTLRSLWFDPGAMAVQRLHGVRVGYIAPFTLFLNAVALFFLFNAATQFQLTTIAEQNAPWMEPIVQQRMAATGATRDVVLDRAETRFQAVYTICLAVISGLGYALIYRLLYRKSMPGWQGAFTLSLYYLAFLFTLFLPWMLVIAPLREKFGPGAALAVVAIGLAIALLWNAAAARRIGGYHWAKAAAMGLAVVVWGFFLDSFMSVVAIWIALRLV